HYNWNGRGGLLGCLCAGRAMGYEHIDVEVYQFGREFKETVVSALGPPIFKNNVIALLVSELTKTRSQGVDLPPVFRARRHAQKTDPVDLLSCAPHEWPCGSAAEKRDEFTPSHGANPRLRVDGQNITGLSAVRTMHRSKKHLMSALGQKQTCAPQ